MGAESGSQKVLDAMEKGVRVEQTVVMSPAEQGGSEANGADESRPAKARTAGAQDEPE